MSGFHCTTRILIAGLLAFAVAGCGGDPDAVKEKSNGTSGDRSKRDMTVGLGGRNQEEGSLFGPGGLLGTRANTRDSNNSGTGVAVNAFLWRASLDTINFIPLVSADPFGGVIISDWYASPDVPTERFKLTIYILDQQLRADGVKVAVFRQIRDTSGAWNDAPVDPKTSTDLENAILTRARQLRLDTAAVR